MIQEPCKIQSKENGWYTHANYLRHLLKINTTQLPIIEFGIGNGSTPILHNYCISNKIQLISIDAEKEWVDKFKHLACDYHKIIAIPDNSIDSWDKITNEIINNYYLIFIDQGSWAARSFTGKKMKYKCQYMVWHDSNYFLQNNIPEIDKINLNEEFVYNSFYDDLIIPTSIVSMYNNCNFNISHD